MKYAQVVATTVATALALSWPLCSTVSSRRLNTAKLTTRLTTPMVPNFATSLVRLCQRSGSRCSGLISQERTVVTRCTCTPYVLAADDEQRTYGQSHRVAS